jgi:hypothetical protein
VFSPTRATEKTEDIAEKYDSLVGENTNQCYGNGR